jgi:CO dehydrogenase maturation factor
MKISVCGKGSSGKSTTVTLLSCEAQARGYRVLVVDADESNTGLSRAFGFDHSPTPLMELVGGKKSLKGKMNHPDIFTETAITTEHIPPPYLLKQDGLMLVSVGKILQSLEGCACPMGVLNREFLKKLVLKADEIAIVDMEAGVEHFGRGVDTSVDCVLIVVEPAFESLEVAKKIRDMAAGIGIKNIWAVLNKVPTEKIAHGLYRELKRISLDVVGCIYVDPKIFQSSVAGGTLRKGIAEKEISEVFSLLLSRMGESV